MIVYYTISLIISVVSFCLLSEIRNISTLSVIPIVVAALLIFWSIYYSSQQNKKTPEDSSYTVSGERFTVDERIKLYSCLSKGFQIMIPVCVPFVLFFNDYVKMFSVLIYFAGIIVGRIFFSIRYSKEVKARINSERKDLENQLKREENGNM